MEHKINELLQKLSLDEKLAMIHGAGLFVQAEWNVWIFRPFIFQTDPTG